jgi:hypothetical protein
MMTPWVAAKHLPHTAALQLHGDLHSKRFHGKNIGKKHGETIGPYGKIMEKRETRGKNKQTNILDHMGKHEKIPTF